MLDLYLASGSPRRQELLAQAGFRFERLITAVEESRHPGESTEAYVCQLGRASCRDRA